jgi:hypothetical protein
MEANPYESPSIEAGDQPRSLALPRIGAVGSWLLALLWAAIGAYMSLSDIALEAFDNEPFVFAMIVLCTFVAPSLFLLLLGCASWRRSARLAVYAATLLLAPTVFYGHRILFW